jgi:hypothetical protein
MPARNCHPVSPDPTRLNDHLSQCAVALGPMHRLRCAAEVVDAFLAPRFVSLLLVMSALLVTGLSL